MKCKLMLLIAAAVCLNAAADAKTPKNKSFVVNTEKLGKEVMGYAGRTPVEIHVTDGRIEKIVALPNSETPAYFQRVQESPIFRPSKKPPKCSWTPSPGPPGLRRQSSRTSASV